MAPKKLLSGFQNLIQPQPPTIEIATPITNFYLNSLSWINSTIPETAGNTARIIVIVTGSEKI